MFLAAQNTQGEVHNESREVKIVAHRGASKFAPENTIAAFEKAYEMGADVVEFDVRETKDGHLVLMHDAFIQRTTDGWGLLKWKKLEKLKTLDAGSWFSEKYKGEEIPTLREALTYLKGKMRPDINMKAGSVDTLVNVLRETGWLDTTLVTFLTSDKEKMKRMNELTDNVMLRPSGGRKKQQLIKRQQELDPAIIQMKASKSSKEYIDLIHDLGMKAWVNTLGMQDTKENMIKAINAGADFIQCDNLNILVPLVEKYEAGESLAE
jgi:glycerophosphoryl diester phosphodiesterase